MKGRHLALCCLSVVLITLAPTQVGAAQGSNSSDCCSIVAKALEATAKIKAGEARSDVERTFRQDGGLFSRSDTVYTYGECPYIKIRVTFAFDPSYKGFVNGSPRDTVVSISKPYLEYPVRD